MQTRPNPTRRPPTTMPRERSAHDAELVDSMDEFLDEVDEGARRERPRGHPHLSPARRPVSCLICGDPRTVAKNRCRCCYEYRRRTGADRAEDLIVRLTERDIERELAKRHYR